MIIRPTDLFELVFHVEYKVEIILKELLKYFNVKINKKNILDIILLTAKNGSKLVGEELNLALNDVIINNCSIWIRCIKNDKFIVEINFIYNSIKEQQKIYINLLNKLAKRLAKKYSITHYYFGLEPADDNDNQYFSEKGYGNLHEELLD